MRKLYGAGPLHLVLITASLAITAAAVVGLVDAHSHTINALIWFGGAIVLHDFVLLPLYAAIDRISLRALSRGRERVPAINHLRVPAALSGLLLLVYFPLIFQLGAPTYRAASGMTQHGYLVKWLAISGALFAGSALVYAIRARRASAVRRANQRPPSSHRARN